MPDSRPIILTVIASRPKWFEEMARSYSGDQAALVERRILEGENRIELDYLPDADLPEPERRRVVYLVPSWWKQPRRRLEVVKARLEWRRRVSRARRGLAGGVRTVNEVRDELMSGELMRRPDEKIRLGDPVEAPGGGPEPLREVDLRGVPTTRDTAVTLGRAAIRERQLGHYPVEFPVRLLWTDVVGQCHEAKLP